MCDEQQLANWTKRGVSRRGFGAGALAGTAAACAPMNAVEDSETGTMLMTENKVSFRTSDGTMDGEFFYRDGVQGPAVIFWPDIAGIRPAKRQMARRLASEGYAVLLANPYYRDVTGQQFEDFAGFAENGGFQKVRPWREKFTVATIQSDTRACADWLMAQEAVDTDHAIGVQGYCMTGSFAVVAPSAHDAVQAGASFHGGGLVRDEATSPHTTLQDDADYLIAIAQNDDAEAPNAKTTLRTAAQAVGADAEIEVYPADHGWCVLDSPSYDQAQAERAWGRLLALYREAL